MLSDYVNRQYDYLALRNTKPAGDTRLGLELFNAQTSGEITTGVQKLVQRWLLEFLTEVGSMPGLPQRGTNFMRAARQGRFRLAINVRAEFSAADLIIRRNLLLEEDDDDPLDERFSAAELTAVSVVPGYDVNDKSGTTAVFLLLGVKIISRAGDARQAIVPIEILPRGEE